MKILSQWRILPQTLFYRLLLGLVMALLLMGCATQRPILYSNERLQEVGQEAAQRDIDECLRLADQAGLKSDTAREILTDTAIGAGTGAALGAAVGAVGGHAGTGAAQGAAGGGVAGFLGGLFRTRDLTPAQKGYVEECLRQKGYQVVGWQ